MTDQPSELFSACPDDLVEDDVFDDLVDETMVIVKSTLEALQEVTYDPRSGPRKYYNRPREEFHKHLYSDYFSENPLYPAKSFRRRFRMSRLLFVQIVSALEKWDDYFTTKIDATNRQGLTPLQKCTAAIRQLANGSATDHLDEYLEIGDSTEFGGYENVY